MLKTTFCKYWTSVKPKLAWPVCTNSMKFSTNSTNSNKNCPGAKTVAKNEVFIGL